MCKCVANCTALSLATLLSAVEPVHEYLHLDGEAYTYLQLACNTTVLV